MSEQNNQADPSNEAKLETVEEHSKESLLPGIDGKQLRTIIGGFATGVTVITVTGTDGKPRGLTANAVSSLSLDPPLLLAAIDDKVDTYPHLMEVGHFAVNILRAGERSEELSNCFAGKGEEKFRDVSYQKGISGAPILDDCFAWLDCQTEITYEGGDHTILIGRVVDAWRDDEVDDPMIFYLGKYRRLAPM